MISKTKLKAIIKEHAMYIWRGFPVLLLLVVIAAGFLAFCCACAGQFGDIAAYICRSTFILLPSWAFGTFRK